ncbi:porin [Niabella insulamsoli]|uniref:porin n=1 Tax=Niabella insulamsoli TaxID=3144874 RepID=UPI0031FD0756
MKGKLLLFTTKALLISGTLLAQTETEEPKGELQINGSVDAYYRFNFQNAKSVGATNNFTSFTNSQNSIELGMASLKASYTKGKAGVVVDLGFGTRAKEFSYAEEPLVNADGETISGSSLLQAIKQAYVVYTPTDNIRISAGKWGTHLGYEVLDPQLNRNYSMSYMFSYGPFSHTGLKIDYNIGEGFGVMAGIANPTDILSASFAKKNVIAQFSKTSESVNAFLNYVGGKDLGGSNHNQIGLTATASISDAFSLGYDGTVKIVDQFEDISKKWWGSALYLNVDPSEKFGITLRGEYFDDSDQGGLIFGTSITQATLSLNIKPVSGLAFIPEFRLDSAKDPIFYKNDGSATKSTGSFLLAAVYSF